MRVFKTLISLLVALFLLFSVGLSTAYASDKNEHYHDYVETIIEPTCEKPGIKIKECICGDSIEEVIPETFHTYCDWIVVREPSAKLDGIMIRCCTKCDSSEMQEFLCQHEFDDWNLVVLPTANANGEEQRICVKCERIESREYICPHENVGEVVIEKATCLKEGLAQNVCNLCNKILSEKVLSITDCSYSEWIVTKYANPNENGERYRYCIYCDDKEYETTTFKMLSGLSIYIESAGIHAECTEADFTQSAVDKYNIVYNTSYLGSSNPIVLGHSHRTLGTLYKTKVGTYIYISKYGDIDTYKVVVSEPAIEIDSGTDFRGLRTGVEFLDSRSGENLRLYTCYYSGGAERWIVIAKKVS